MHLPRTILCAVGALAALAGARALVSLLAAADSGGSAAAPGTPVPAAAIPRLTAITHHAAASSGDSGPEWITAVLSTRAKALTSATPGNYLPGAADVTAFLITMRGHFTATAVPRPLGRVSWILVDAGGDPGGVRQGGGGVNSGAIGDDDNAAGRRLGADPRRRRSARHGLGAKAPTGLYLSLVIDAQTFQRLDFGIGPVPPPAPPASLGPVTYLHV